MRMPLLSKLITSVMIVVAANCALSSLSLAQDQSVNPGVNKQFENPTATEFIGRFERDGRDPYDHRFQVIEAMNLKPGMAVADIGAGTGLFTRLFSPIVGPQGKVFAVDIADNFVKHVERQAQADGLTNIVGVVCHSDSANLPPASIDLAFICDAYHHFEYPNKTMRSIHDALKPGGQVVLIDFQKIPGVSSDFVMGHVRAGQEVFTKEIVEAGFEQIDERKGLLKESYFVRFRKIDK
jgi:predicted methyltransferase